MRGKALIDKLPEVISDRLASMPVFVTLLANASVGYGTISSCSFYTASNSNRL
jgi:hypothetical protein